ncbi:unnamed protein product [Urochloa decumbens]|uniref:F-box domain-containing protein n=1 Tax=Urochloa decumbens TaxID=240449 RepID=A0ABC9FSK9_9POAL
MGSNRRRQPRRRKDEPTNKAPNKPTAASRSDEVQPPAGEATPAVHDHVPDHVLELILLRLDSSISLVRAAATCKLWFRVVADAGFLARFRLRVPLVLGHYHNFVHQRPAVEPSSPTPKRNSAPFSLDFVPEFRGTWEAVDSRDGLLLLRNNNLRFRSSSSSDDPDLAVCEPKTRRYQPISMPAGNLSTGPAHLLGLFLLRGGATGIRHGGDLSASMSNFKVLMVVLRAHMLDSGRGVPGARVYHGTKCCWREMRCEWTGNVDVPATAASFYFAGRANGCLYWGLKGSSRAAALVLDGATAGVSLEALPACMEGWSEAWCFRVVGGGEDGSLRAVRLTENNLRVFRRLKAGGEWVLEKLVRFPKDIHGFLGRAMIVAADETYALVMPRHSWGPFSVDLETMAVERVRERNGSCKGPGYPYELPWPPILKP